MGFIKTILIAVLVLIGGCTVVVGGCTVGVTKASIGALHSMTEFATESHFSTLYKANPAKAERLYVEVATDCYRRSMRQKMGSTVPDRIADERVNFDIFEIRTLRAQDEERMQYLADWRVQSDKKIVLSLKDHSQRSAVKRYLKDVRKGNLKERMCLATGLSPNETNGSSQSRKRYGNSRI